jgi:hypothetical protein
MEGSRLSIMHPLFPKQFYSNLELAAGQFLLKVQLSGDEGAFLYISIQQAEHQLGSAGRPASCRMYAGAAHTDVATFVVLRLDRVTVQLSVSTGSVLNDARGATFSLRIKLRSAQS